MVEEEDILEKTNRLHDKIEELEEDRNVLLNSNETLVNVIEQMYAFLVTESREGNLDSKKLYQTSDHRADGKIDIDSIRYDIMSAEDKISKLNYNNIKE